jgi:hypothetical protein
MLAVYKVAAAKVPDTAGVHVTVPLYCAFSAMEYLGYSPTIGAFTPPMAGMFITMLPVAGNTAVIMLEPAALVTDVAPATVKKFAPTPCRV